MKRISKSAKDADKEILKLHTEERKSSVLHGLFVPLKRHDGKYEDSDGKRKEKVTEKKDLNSYEKIS